MIDKIIGQLLEEEPEDYKSDWFEPGIQMLRGSGKMADWIYHKDRTWQIHTDAKNQDTLIIQTPYRDLGHSDTEPVVPMPQAFYEIVKGIMENLAGFRHLVFVLVQGDAYEAMLSAIEQLNGEGWLRVTRRSGMALFADVLHRNRRFESEGDMELDISDLLRVHQEPLDYAAPSYLHDPEGNRLRKSRNLRGIRTYVSRFPVTKVQIWQRDRGEGVITITFRDGAFWTDRFADFGMLKQVLRTWRNLYGAELEIENEPAGKVGYRNPKLMEAYDDEAFDSAEAKEIGAEAATVYSLDQIKAAEPEFFSRENTRFFGTKKIYQYGNYIVLKNRKRSRGYFGNVSDYTSYVIYHFIMTHDRPNGLLLHKASTGSLADAKEMIKKNDFRSRRERVADELAKMGQGRVAEAEEVQFRQLSPDEITEMGYVQDQENDAEPVMRMSVPGAFVDFAEVSDSIFILYVETQSQYQRQGKASQLLHALKEYADRTGKSVAHGTFSEEGEAYLKPLINSLWPKISEWE